MGPLISLLPLSVIIPLPPNIHSIPLAILCVHCHVAVQTLVFVTLVTGTNHMQGLSLFFALSSPIIQVTSLLNRMQLRAEKSVSGDNDSNITVSVPPIRSDVLHPCDVMEVVIILNLVIFLIPLFCIKYVYNVTIVFFLTRHAVFSFSC